MEDVESEYAAIRGWRAEEWSTLRSVWTQLNLKPPDGPMFRAHPLSPQGAGWLFERLILEAFRLAGAAIHYPFKVPTSSGRFIREEEDGLVMYGWQGFLIESKFQEQRTDIDPIFRLHALVEQRPIGTMGLFFSISGFTDPAKESSEYLKPIRVLLFERDDLEWPLSASEPRRMKQMFWRKWALALKLSKPFLPITQYDDTERRNVTDPAGFVGEPDHEPTSETANLDREPAGATHSEGPLSPGAGTGQG